MLCACNDLHVISRSTSFEALGLYRVLTPNFFIRDVCVCVCVCVYVRVCVCVYLPFSARAHYSAAQGHFVMSAGLSLNMWARYARVLPRETCVAPHGAPSFAPRMYRRLLHAQPRLYPNELNTRAQTLLAHTNASTIAKFSSCHMQKSFFATVPHMHPRVNNDCVIMNGKATATKILEEIRTKVDVLKQKYNQVPGLAGLLLFFALTL